MHIAIIGAGAAGLSVALTLHSRGIKCTIYEAKNEPFRGLGALMLAPNALRILDSLGLYTQLRSRGFNFSTVQFRDEIDAKNDEWQMGNQTRYGYDALRIGRPTFLDTLRAAVTERGIEVKYATRYSHIVSETAEGVVFALVDGTHIRTDILVGADGVYSEVRKYIAPEVQPKYSGKLAVIAAVRHRFTDPSHPTLLPQTTFYHNSKVSDSILVMPQEQDGSQACLARQISYPEQSREDWVHLSYDKERLYSLFLDSASQWPARVQSALSQVDKSSLYIWPFQLLPDLPSWTSLPHRRTILLGDAVHSIPPTAGQGACQAIEDAYTLAMVIATLSRTLSLDVNNPNLVSASESFAKSIATWQNARQERVQRARLFTRQLDNNRLSAEQRHKLEPGTYWEGGKHPDLSWLYGAGLANSSAKGVTRVEVKKDGRKGMVTRVRAATVDGTYGMREAIPNLQRIGAADIVKGAC